MPTYVYECQACREPFEVRASIPEKEAGLAATCPRCGADDARQVITGAFLLGSSRGADLPSGPFPRCGPGGPGPGCCG